MSFVLRTDRAESTASSSSTHRKFSGLLHGIGAYKRKLQEQGLINSIDDQLYDSSNIVSSAVSDEDASVDYSAGFNELEMLQLIPVIIGELQFRRISSSDQAMLHSIFGSLWPLMVEEADRRRERRRAARSMTVADSTTSNPTLQLHHQHIHQQQQHWPPIDPVLKSILRAQRDHDYAELSREQAYVRSQNSIVSGAAGADEHSMAAKLAKLWTEQNGNVEPSQRILKLAAILIHEQMVRRQKRAQRKSLRRHANAVAAREAAAAAAIAEAASVLRVQRAGDAAAMRRKRAAADIIDDTDNDADYSYDDLSDDSVDDEGAAMYEDVAEKGRTIISANAVIEGDAEDDDADDDSDANSADLDPTLVALRSDDRQLLRHMYGVTVPQKRFGGSVTELFNLAARHRELNDRRNARRWHY